MPKFRKKPVVIEAVRVRDLNGEDEPPPWLTRAIEHGTVVRDDCSMRINTLEGVMVANYDDWIIQGTKREIYPCKPDVFADIYEEVIE